jgi:hypothetical protein
MSRIVKCEKAVPRTMTVNKTGEATLPSQRRRHTMVAKNPFPDGALPVFGGPQAWYGPEAVRSREWIHEFDRQELAEIDSAVAACVEPARRS